jgi:uncharacterized protein
MWFHLGVLCGLFAASLAGAQSFACSDARTDTERAICTSPRLAELDSRVAANYQMALDEASQSGRGAIRADQGAWLAQRDICGEDAACIEREMRSRLMALTFGYVRPDGEDAVAMGSMSGVYCARDAADRLVVEEREAAARFSVESWQANGHSCGTPALLGYAQNGAYVAQDGDCTLRLEPVGETVVLTARPVEACKSRYCGARAVIDRMVFPVSARRELGPSTRCE